MLETTQQQPSPDYPVADLNSFIDEINQPKQDFNLNIRPDDDDFEDYTPDDEPLEKIDTQMKSSAAKAGGILMATVVDSVLPASLGAIAHTDADQFKVSDRDRDDLAEALTEYMRLKGGDIPPGVMVILLILSLYGSQIPHAISLRKHYNSQKDNKHIGNNPNDNDPEQTES